MAKVLIADRSRSLKRLLTRVLSSGGHTVLESDGGDEALEMAGSEYPDLVIIDSGTSGSGGLELSDNLRSNPATEQIPVIVLGESVRGESAALRAGAANYIIKPIQGGTMDVAVRAALRDAPPPRAVQARQPRPTAPQARDAQPRVPSDPPQVAEPPARRLASGPLTSGVTQLDQILRGGIPLGSLTLVEGNPGSGKSILCQHIAHEALQAGASVSYLSSEHTPESLLKQMASIGLDTSRYLRSGALRVQVLEKPTEQGASGGQTISLVQVIAQLSGQDNVVIVDSITDHLRGMSENAVIDTFVASNELCGEGKTILLAARSYVFGRGMLNRLHSICNTHFILGEEMLGARTVKSVQVSKVRGVDAQTKNLIVFDVVPNIGIKYVPGARVRV